MAKGKLITSNEKERICSLFKAVGCVKEVARMVNRDPAAVRKLVKRREVKKPYLFNWKDYPNSIIL